MRTLLTQAVELAQANGAQRIREIHVQVGPLSGVEPALFASAFEQLRAEGVHDIETLHVKEVALAARCTTCGEEFAPAGFRFRCPRCDGVDTQVVRGDCVVLESLVVADVDEGAAA